MSQCMAKACMCVTHGMPCVTMHGHYEGYIYGSQIQLGGRGSSFSPWEQQGGGGREKEKEVERRREREEREGGREERRGERKEEKRREKGRKRGKRKRKRKECCAVSRPGRQRTRNCVTGGRFPPTLVILRLGAV